MAYATSKKLGAKVPATGEGKRLMHLRRTLSLGFDWLAVDMNELRTALFTAGLAGAGLMISPASGGRGICLKLYLDDDKEIVYVNTGEELNELLGQVIDMLQPDGQDHRAIMRMTPHPPVTAQALKDKDIVHSGVSYTGKTPATLDAK